MYMYMKDLYIYVHVYISDIMHVIHKLALLLLMHHPPCSWWCCLAGWWAFRWSSSATTCPSCSSATSSPSSCSVIGRGQPEWRGASSSGPCGASGSAGLLRHAARVTQVKAQMQKGSVLV